MVTKESTPPKLKPILLIPKREAKQKLEEQLLRGKELYNQKINSSAELNKAQANKFKWGEFTEALIGSIVDNSEDLVGTYRMANRVSVRFTGNTVNNYKQRLQRCITLLESIIERLELLQERLVNHENFVHDALPSLPSSREIFIVHGHDEATRESVARFLEKLNLKPIILHEQANGGMTIIEKLARGIYKSLRACGGCIVI
ncbi:TIR domain-containing protein [Vampirovibrio sp.]|uniref:TIR domain-containing protein n=1 Tax=Vampirovibrio sp. TaxID=2717857 RepID=UPI003592F116